MSLIKYNRPNKDLRTRTFNDIIDEFFTPETTFREDSFMPSVDVSETDKQFEISVELPGLQRQDIKVNLEKSRLAISGQRKFKNEEEGKNFHRIETQYGFFNRSFYLPDTIDEESISAKYENGILNITVNKNEEKAKKQIEIA